MAPAGPNWQEGHRGRGPRADRFGGSGHFVHGGPGYNAYGFERSIGPRLERSIRMVYLDQRGCGRSAGGAEDLPLGMDETVADFERLRAQLGIARWSVIAHSYGGLVALVYASRHVDAIEIVFKES